MRPRGVKMVAPGSSLSPPIPGCRSRWELLSVCCAAVVPPVMGTKPAIGPAPCPGFHARLKAFGFRSLWPPWSTWTCRSSRASAPSPTRSGKAALRRGSLCPHTIQSPLLCLVTLSLSCGQINGPPKTSGPNLWNLTRDYMAKRGVCRCNKVKDLEMGTWDKPDYLGGTLNVITGVLIRGRQRGV